MLMRLEKKFTLCGVPQIGVNGEETRAQLGEIRCAVSSQTAKESLDNEVRLATETATAFVAQRWTPPGGFLRGMELKRGDAVYRILTPVENSAGWTLKCARIHIG